MKIKKLNDDEIDEMYDKIWLDRCDPATFWRAYARKIENEILHRANVSKIEND